MTQLSITEGAPHGGPHVTDGECQVQHLQGVGRRRMHTRALATSGLKVSAIGLHGPERQLRQPVDESAGIALIRAATDLGVTFFDTAEVYGPFTTEELVGKALASVRDQVVIATKFAYDYDQASNRQGLGCSPAHIRQAVEGSLCFTPSRSTCSTSTAPTPTCPSKTSPTP